MNLQGEPLRVGHHVHAAEREVEPETVAFYRETFRDDHPCYREGSPSGSPIAPPLLFHSEVYAHVERWYLKNIVGNLHARQEWMLFQPLRPGARILTRSTVVERYRKRSRDCIVNEVDYMDGEGRLLVRGRTHQSFLAEQLAEDSGFVVDKSSAREKKARPVGEGPGEEIEPVELLIDEPTCWRFSGPVPNYHTDRDEARKLGFPEIVVQGMLSTCLISQAMANAFGEGWFAGGHMDVKLINVAWAGERLLAKGKLREELSEGSLRRRVLEVWAEKVDAAQTPVVVGTATALI
jgi:acyl dehydratase